MNNLKQLHKCISLVPKPKSKFELFPWERNRTWIVKETFTVDTRFGKSVTVPAGFKHDRFSFAPDIGDCEIGAIVHDYIYTFKNFSDGTKATKSQADKILYDLLYECGHKWISKLYFVGVLIGGFRSWNAKRV